MFFVYQTNYGTTHLLWKRNIQNYSMMKIVQNNESVETNDIKHL